MGKVKWEAADADDILTADAIDEAEDTGFKPYAGAIPRGGVYRFRLKRSKFTTFNSNNQGFNNLLELDGSWKEEHAQFDGCPLWDRVVMTKAAAAFARAFAQALGVSSRDLIERVVVNDDDVVTKIGDLSLVKKNGDPADILLYVNVKRGTHEGEPRLETAGTGYLVLETEEEQPAARRPAKAAKAAPAKASGRKAQPEPDPEPEAKAGKGSTKGKAGKKGKGSKAADDEPPF